MESLNDLIWNDEDGISTQGAGDKKPMPVFCMVIPDELCGGGGGGSGSNLPIGDSTYCSSAGTICKKP